MPVVHGEFFRLRDRVTKPRDRTSGAAAGVNDLDLP
jgi:hypothetical protein